MREDAPQHSRATLFQPPLPAQELVPTIPLPSSNTLEATTPAAPLPLQAPSAWVDPTEPLWPGPQVLSPTGPVSFAWVAGASSGPDSEACLPPEQA